MQEPVNFSRTTVYSKTQELAMRLLNNLRTHNCSLNSSPPINFDLKASSHPRDCPVIDISGQRVSILSNTWAAFPPNAFLAAIAAAAFSIKSATNNTTSCLCETVSPIDTSSKTDIHKFIEKAISEHALLPLPRNSASSKLTVSADSSVNQEVDSDPCLQPQLTKRNSRTSEHGHRSRVVIHQFGDAEDHFSKALRNLRVKSAGECELIDGSSTTHKRMWKLTSTFDGDDGSPDTSLSSPYYEVQNIADLAVERHFEKSLATFHAKQAAAASGAATNIAVALGESISKSSLDLSLSRTQPPFSLSPSSSNSSSDGSILFSPREDASVGPSFNPKKKWLAQYGDDEGTRNDEDGRKNGVWSSNNCSWNTPNASDSTNIDKRSKSCPLLLNESAHSLKAPPHCRPKYNLSSNNSTKLMELSRAAVAQSLVSSHQLPLRGFSALARTISLEVPSLGNSIDFFDDEDEVMVASKSISAQDSPVSSPIAASSGFFTDSTYSLDSSTLPVISEASYFSSNPSVSSSFKARHVAALRENAAIVRQREHGYFGCESEEAVEANVINSQGRIRKRTASDASDFSSLKRSRSVVDADCGEHS